MCEGRTVHLSSPGGGWGLARLVVVDVRERLDQPDHVVVVEDAEEAVLVGVVHRLRVEQHVHALVQVGQHARVWVGRQAPEDPVQQGRFLTLQVAGEPMGLSEEMH